MNVKFYLNKKDKKTADKQLVTPVFEKDVKLKENTSELDPVFIMSGDCVGVNYFYVPSWGKYYFITTPPIFLVGGFVEIHGHVDILSSVWGLLKEKQALIDRNEFNYSDYIIDEKALIENKRDISHHIVGAVGNMTGNYIAVTVTGGGVTS